MLNDTWEEDYDDGDVEVQEDELDIADEHDDFVQ